MPIAPKTHAHHKPLAKQHQAATKQSYDNKRGHAASRGYNYKWQKYRKQYLSKNPLCVMCQTKGKVTPATVVDHINPVDGKNDPLFYIVSNHQALCRDCHSYKTRVIDKRGYGASK